MVVEYRTSRKAIVSLGGDGESEYKDLSVEDIDIKSIGGGRDKRRTGKLTDGWIFKKVISLAGGSRNDTKWENDSM
jgi:hypothetical protein